MPTGYTYKVVDGTTASLKEFALDCARAFGPLIELKDAPRDANITASPTRAINHSRERLQKTKEDRAKLQAYTEDDWEAAAKRQWIEILESRRQYRLKYEEERSRIESMLDKVRAWKAKYSPESLADKGKLEYFNFLEDQLIISLPYKLDDSEKAENDPTAPLHWKAFSTQELTKIEEDVAYWAERLQENIDMLNSRQKWLDHLRDMINEIEE